MLFKKILLPAVFLALIFTSCKSVNTYTLVPSTLNYLMEAPAVTEKSGESIFVRVNKVKNTTGRVENLDLDFLYLVFYTSQKVDQIYYLDSAGYKENLRDWAKMAMDREIERNSRFTIAANEAEADYVLGLDIESMAAWSRKIFKSSEVYVPMGVGYGAVPLTVNRNCLLPGAFGQVQLRYHLLDNSGKHLLENQYKSKVEYSDSNAFILPLTQYNLNICSNANAVEHLSLSFQKNFTSIIDDLNNLPVGSAMKMD